MGEGRQNKEGKKRLAWLAGLHQSRFRGIKDVSRCSLLKRKGEAMFTYKRTVTIAIVFFVFFLLNLVPIMAYALNEPAQEKEKVEPSPGVSEQPVIIGEATPYTLGNGDVLQITVRNQPEFSGQFVIGPDGKIQYTFVGDIEAAGLTKAQLKEKLIKELEKFVKVPEISIAIAIYNSKIVYVLGEVARPGKYPMKGDVISLRDAIAEAGLPTREAALRRIYIITYGPKKPTCRKIDLFALLYKGKLKYNIDLFPGDIVVVPSTVPSEINRALNTLLQPVFNAAAVDALLYRNR
jgi:polysaccharide export outer membrane protein